MKTALLTMIALLAIGPIAHAGDLEPTAPPASTMKTLDEVEARIPIPGSDTPVGTFIISQSGSYYLTGNRTSSAIGILVDANDVVIDLNGYSLIGSGGTYGVYMSGKSNIEIRNGTIRDFDYSGIVEGSNSLGKNHRIINVRAIGNGLAASYSGIQLNGTHHLVKDCTAETNSYHGIYVGLYSQVLNCISTDNGSNGINALDSATITGNYCSFNQSDGIYAKAASSIANNTCYDNVSYGIITGADCSIVGNISSENGYIGIKSGDGCTISGNTASANGNSGIYASTGSSVIGNTARKNYNWGIYLLGNNVVDQNTAYSNATSGSYGNMNVSASSTYGTNHAP